jgi:hypothetical protein
MDSADASGGSGGSGAGGFTGSGGTGAGGSATTSVGTVTFDVHVAPGSSFCDNVDVCNPVSHFGVRDASGRTLPLRLPFCAYRCTAECSPPICPGIACIPMMAAVFTGGQFMWGGAYYEGGTCGANVPCSYYEPRYAPAGRYVATFCALPGSPSTNPAEPQCVRPAGQTATCVDVPFELPSATPIDVTLGA